MPRGPQYTEEELIEDLRDLADQLERYPPLKRDMNEQGNHSARTYQLRFGSWSDAVSAAGFTPRKKGQNYEERPKACPLCGTEQTGLDFHHWRYGKNEKGCYLCRECHDTIHEGEASTDNPDWLLHAVENLVTAHLENHDDDPGPADLCDRYNLTNIEELVAAALDK